MLIEVERCVAPPLAPVAVMVTVLKLTVMKTQYFGSDNPRANWCFEVSIDGQTRHWGFPGVSAGMQYRLDWQRTIVVRGPSGVGRSRELRLAVGGQNLTMAGTVDLPTVAKSHGPEDDWGVLDPTFAASRPMLRRLTVDGENSFAVDYVVEPMFNASQF
ncbi:MAG TPA: hypothetical protein VK864_09095 [Longimicrobiales bacterium]|nr:hypothetical protein [Longimicrobiales bacterium]